MFSKARFVTAPYQGFFRRKKAFRLGSFYNYLVYNHRVMWYTNDDPIHHGVW